MALLHLRPADYLAMPWKDGGGVTEQIAIEPPDATLAGGFLWRLSMARVERSGPFSRFEGYDRTLLLLEGGGLDLDFGIHGRVRLEAPLQPVVFSGDWEARAALTGGPVRDLGVISDRARVRQDVRVLASGDGSVLIPAAPTAWIIALTGRWALAPQGLELAPLEAARLDGESSEARGLSPDARCLLVRFEPRA
ncbi:MAG TPA: HutD family protein [Holophagaceae bacterium]|nr:HutD family protein [Holophagaceae bacterium]